MAGQTEDVRREGAQADGTKPEGAATSAAARRKRDAAVHRRLRYGLQIAFFIVAPGAFSGAFNGVKYLFTQVGSVAAMQWTAFLALLVALLAFTIVFGRFFCGYACAFGTLGDVLFGVFESLRVKTGVKRPKFPGLLVKSLSLVKYVVLAAICAACAFGAWSAVSGYSPWVAFASLTNLSAEGLPAAAWVLLGLVVVGMIVRERFFCQFLCPLGALFSLMPQLGFSEFTRTRCHCAPKCGRCKDSCPVDLWPDADTLGHGECIACGRCATVCPMGNVNLVAVERAGTKDGRLRIESESSLVADDAPESEIAASSRYGSSWSTADETRLERPVRKTRDAYWLLRGTEPGVVLAKAALLLAVLWMTGATRYLPAFSSLFG